MSQSYLAGVIAGPRRIELRQVQKPDPAPGYARVRLEGCGICGSNLPVWEGRPWFTYPLEPGAPGHEGWGVIEVVADDVDGFTPGDRVAMLSYHAFAEIDACPAQQMVKLPDSLSGKPFPGEALGCAMNVFARAAIKPGQRVALLGAGYLGAQLIELSAKAGATVHAYSRRDFSLEVARAAGAEMAIQLEDHQKVLGAMRDLTGGEGYDCVIEATGAQWPLDLAGEFARERGRIVVAGYHQDGLRQVNMQLWNWKGVDVINAHERDPAIYIDGIRKAVEASANGTSRIAEMFTQSFKMDQLGTALDLMHSREGNFLKAIVAYD